MRARCSGRCAAPSGLAPARRPSARGSQRPTRRGTSDMVRVLLSGGTPGEMKQLIVVCLVLGSMGLLSGCGSGAVKPAPGMGCSLNSQCAAGLVCTFGACHIACHRERRLPDRSTVREVGCGGRRRRDDAGTIGASTINVCQLPHGGDLRLQQQLQVAAGLRPRRAVPQPVPAGRRLRLAAGLHRLEGLRAAVAAGVGDQ